MGFRHEKPAAIINYHFDRDYPEICPLPTPSQERAVSVSPGRGESLLANGRGVAERNQYPCFISNCPPDLEKAAWNGFLAGPATAANSSSSGSGSGRRRGGYRRADRRTDARVLH